MLKKLRENACERWLFDLLYILKMPEKYLLKDLFLSSSSDRVSSVASARIFELDIIPLIFTVKLLDLLSGKLNEARISELNIAS